MPRAVVIAVLCLGLGLCAGCASTVKLSPSPAAAAAVAEASIKTDRNKNTEISLEVKYMPPPDMLTPPRSVYVVWAESSDGEMVKLGQLRISSKRKASFQTVTPLTRFRLSVTAESSADVRKPSAEVLLKGSWVSK